MRQCFFGQRLKSIAALTCAALALAACNRGGADWRDSRAEPANSSDAPSGYVRPPQILSAARAADTGVVLAGDAEPDVRLRLASPDGGAYGATSDDNGHWILNLPASASVRLFGLSEEIGGRLVQGEGYVAVLPPPGRPAVLLRAGGGATALIDSQALRVAAVDFDAAGGGEVSGTAKPGSALRVVVDGAPAGEGHAGPHGHFTMALSAPAKTGDRQDSIVLTSALKPGAHQIAVQSGGELAQAAVSVSPPPASFSGLPYQGERVAGGWRIDWLTPGGGPQSTVVLDPAGAGS